MRSFKLSEMILSLHTFPPAPPDTFTLKSISFRTPSGEDLGGSIANPVVTNASNKLDDLLALRLQSPTETALALGVVAVTIISADGCKNTLSAQGHSTIVTESSLDTPLSALTFEIMAKAFPSEYETSLDIRKLITFQRTIRVPDDGKTHNLPPGLGSFEVVSGDNGDMLLPMYQAEAMWMSFNNDRVFSSYALKVGVGNVCSITGKRWVPGELTQSPQNYVVIPEQPWLDGILNPKNRGEEDKQEATVRQFVAMPMESEASIEKQLVDSGLLDKAHGGLRLEVFPTMENFSCWIPGLRHLLGKGYGFNMTPRQLGMKGGERLVIYDSKYRKPDAPELMLADFGLTSTDEVVLTCRRKGGGNVTVHVRTLTNRSVDIYPDPDLDTAEDVKLMLQDKEGIPPDQQRLVSNGKLLEDHRTLSDYEIGNGSIVFLVLRLRGGGMRDPGMVHSHMGIAAGGVIKQKIYADERPVGRFCTSHFHSVDISIVNSLQFSASTGRRMPKPTVTKETYDNCGLPWFKLYDGDMEAVTAVSACLFSRVKSIGDKEVRGRMGTGADMCCICMDAESNAMLSPCGHKLCSDCVQYMQRLMSGDQCKTRTERGCDLTCPLCRKDFKMQDILYSSAPLRNADISKNESWD